MTFAEKLKQIRIGCHLTQEQIAELIGVTRKTIILYESGDRTPKQEKVYVSLAQHFKTSVDFWKIGIRVKLGKFRRIPCKAVVFCERNKMRIMRGVLFLKRRNGF